MSSMFYGCTSLTTLEDLKDWNVSSVTTMISMFKGCTGLTKLDISGWSVNTKVKTGSMFNGCGELVTTWASSDKPDFSGVTSSASMFTGCEKLKGGDGSTIKTVQALDSTNYLKATYAKIGTGSADASTAGYFTDVSKKTTG